MDEPITVKPLAAVKELTADEFEKIKTRAQQIKTNQDKVKTMFKGLADLYWISETNTGIGNSSSQPRYNQAEYGQDDIRLTASTSSRDRVVGLHRMLRTTRPQFKVECSNKTYANKIEKALDKWWDANNEKRRASIESELTLSGILFTDENISVSFVDDLLQGEDNKVRRRRLEGRRKETPAIINVDSPLITYPVWGEDGLGLSEYLIITDITGRKLKEKWGGNYKDDTKYTLWDYKNLEVVCTWEGNSKDYLRGGYHELDEIPSFSAITDGTDLFFEEERKRSPFLYGMLKSGLAEREDEALTSLFTSSFARGHGGLILIDGSEQSYNSLEIQVNHAGLVRYAILPGRGQFVDDKAFDGNLLQLLNMTQTLGERTTIPSQTLGENIAPGTTYSGYAMASQNGRIPLIPVQEATQKVIKDACMYILGEFKRRGIEWEGLEPNEITDDFTLTVTLEVDLPQDEYRNAQMLQQLKNAGFPLSNEWVHNRLQIKDSDQMTFDTMAEKAMQLAFERDAPNLVEQVMQMLQMAAGPGMGAPGGPGGPGGMMPPGGQENMGAPSIPGGPGAAMAGGEVMPAVEPMNPDQMNPGVAY